MFCMRINPKPFLIIGGIVAAIIIIGSGASYYINRMDRMEGQQNAVLQSASQSTDLSAWIVEWEQESGENDYKALNTRLSEMQMFASYFDSSGHLWLKDAFRENLANKADLRQFENGTFLTIVNDRINDDGSVVQKDADLVRQLTHSKVTRQEHIRNIVDVANQLGLDGVEIDYENINSGNWNGVVALYRELYQALLQHDRKLRIVLEPSAPLQNLELPEGPEYVVMAYNLYGYHSGPGPKADKKFIQQLIRKMEAIPGNKRLAIATGGFAWNGNGKVKAVTEKEAQELSLLSQDGVERDVASGSLYFNYINADGSETTVWYADGVTLRDWIRTARDAGCHRIAIWRLGGLSQYTLKILAEME